MYSRIDFNMLNSFFGDFTCYLKLFLYFIYFLMQSPWEAPPINAKNTLIITKDEKPLFGAPFIGMGIVAAPHQASNSAKKIALGTDGFGLSTVDPATLPTNAAEVLRARGGFDIAGAAATGAAALALTGVAALMVAKNITDRRQNG
jgi:hypothetical protein